MGSEKICHPPKLSPSATGVVRDPQILGLSPHFLHAKVLRNRGGEELRIKGREKKKDLKNQSILRCCLQAYFYYNFIQTT